MSQPQNSLISTEYTDFIAEKDKAFWKVELNNGLLVYQDDDRPDQEEKIAWYRLKQYCNSRNLFPRKMWLTFRSHTEYCGESNLGYFFSFGVKSSLGGNKEYRYLCGPLTEPNLIHVTIWKVPELLSVEEELRPVDGYEGKIICTNHLLMGTNVQNITT